MPRPIEYQFDGVWRPWNDPFPPHHYSWRYVGGILECDLGEKGWHPMTNQATSLEELHAKWPDSKEGYRLRPYDDQRRALSHDPQGRGVIVDLLDVVADGIQRTKETRATSRTDVSAVDCSDFGARVIAAAAEYRSKALENAERANRLSDTCGALKTELNEAYAKIGRLEREIERMTKAARSGRG